MRICRYAGDAGEDRLGVVQGQEILDVTPALDAIPMQRWPLAQGDPLLTHFAAVKARIAALLPGAPRRPLAGAKLLAPVPNPSKIINAPINYAAHIDEAKKDQGIAHGRDIKNIWDWGLFLKANSALIGCGEEIRLRMPERRNDHEVELAVIIGAPCNKVPKADALKYVAGYAIGLDMTIRGPELPSFRKSVDTYAVLGPWLTTADEIGDPGNLRLFISVNGETRQDASTARMVYDVPKLIEYASSMYTLLPGDLIFSGTPEGVGPVKPGDLLHAEIEKVGAFDIRVAAEYG